MSKLIKMKLPDRIIDQANKRMAESQPVEFYYKVKPQDYQKKRHDFVFDSLKKMIT